MAVVTHQDMLGFQQQYGTLFRAIEFYLDGKMPVEQAASLERAAGPEFIAAVAQTRLLRALVDTYR